MLWVYGVFVIIGAVTMYGSAAGLSGKEGNASKEPAALPLTAKPEPREYVYLASVCDNDDKYPVGDTP